VIIYIREFSDESNGERIVKISRHLPKLLSIIKGDTFLRRSVLICMPKGWMGAAKSPDRHQSHRHQSKVDGHEYTPIHPVVTSLTVV